jgi:hypothetical protein
MSKNEKEVLERGTTDIAIANIFEQDASGGFEGMGQDDLALPFLRLLAANSPEIGELEGALPGMIYNTVTGELHDGKSGITVIPCAYVRQYIEWTPRGQGTGAPVAVYPATSDILSRTIRDKTTNKDYLENGNYIENTANHYVMVLNDGIPEPALISMKATQLKKSRKWNSMMMSVKAQTSSGQFYTPPMYSQRYVLTTSAESNDKGKWYGWDVAHIGAVTSKEMYEAARKFSQSIAAGAVSVKHSSEESSLDSHAF